MYIANNQFPEKVEWKPVAGYSTLALAGVVTLSVLGAGLSGKFQAIYTIIEWMGKAKYLAAAFGGGALVFGSYKAIRHGHAEVKRWVDPRVKVESELRSLFDQKFPDSGSRYDPVIKEAVRRLASNETEWNIAFESSDKKPYLLTNYPNLSIIVEETFLPAYSKDNDFFNKNKHLSEKIGQLKWMEYTVTEDDEYVVRYSSGLTLLSEKSEIAKLTQNNSYNYKAFVYVDLKEL